MIEKVIEFRPAYDKRSSDPKKNYGIHGVELIFLYGDKEVGYVQFVVYTNWMLEHLRPKWNDEVKAFTLQPLPDDLGYHSKVPQYENQTSMECHLLGTCFYDGSTLQAKELFETLVEKGHNGVWQKLEEYYQRLFQ